MKEYPQCLLCRYVFGRSCKLKGEKIEDSIYYNERKCGDYAPLAEADLNCEDSCCSENTRYKESLSGRNSSLS